MLSRAGTGALDVPHDSSEELVISFLGKKENAMKRVVQRI